MPSARGSWSGTEIRQPLEITEKSAVSRVTKLRKVQNKALRENFKNRFAVVDVQPFSTRDLKLVRIETKLFEDGGVDVGHVVPVLNGVETDLISRPVYDSTLNSAASHPY